MDTFKQDNYPFHEPNCVCCLQKKLCAQGAVTFFKDQNGSWRVGTFEGNRPSESVEVDLYCMLEADVPETILKQQCGFILSNEDAIRSLFPGAENLFKGYSIIASPIQYQELRGVRIAWREISNPFRAEELRIIECIGLCPNGCAPCS